MALKLNGTNSVAAPAYAGADADTGLQCGTDEVNLVTGGTARLHIDSSGNVLVGKTTTALTTVGTRISSGFISNAASSSSTNLGTNAGGAISLANTNSTDNNFSNIGGYNSNGLVVNQINFINTSHSSRTGEIGFSTHNGSGLTERMRIDSSGNVGINQTPTRELSLHSPNNNNSYIHFTNDDTGETSSDGALVGIDGNEDLNINNQESSKNIIFRNNGSERMRIDSSGRLLINTSTSASELILGVGGGLKLSRNTSGSPTNGQSLMSVGFHGVNDTNSNAAAEAKIEAFAAENHSGSTAASNLRFYTKPSGTGPGSAPSERMRIAANGDVGIGVAPAAQKLQVHESAATTESYVHITNAVSGSTSSDGLLVGLDTSANAILWNMDNTVLKFGTNNTERIRIDNSGRVGIGTSVAGSFNSAADDLVVRNSGSCGVTICGGTSGNSNLYFADGTSGSEAYRGYITYAHAADQFEFATAGTEQMRLDNNGTFYLNTTSHNNYEQTSGDGSLVWRNDTGSSAGSLILSSDADNGWSSCYMNKFDWSSGDDGRYINFYKNGNGLSSIQLNSSGTVDYNTGSDYRLKENIVPMTNGITRLKQLLPKQFNMIDDPDDNLCDGFLAHEAQTVVPQAVCGTHNGMRTDEEGNEVPEYQGMDYGKLTPLLTAALQEAIGKIETLETQNADLLARVTALETA